MGEENKLSQNFTRRGLLRYAFPTAVMMLFESTYSIVDGLFASNFVGSAALAAIALVSPFAMVLAGFGFMLGTGGAALIAKTMGEGNLQRARGLFTFLIISVFAIGALLAAVAIPCLPGMLTLMGAKQQLVSMAVDYGKIIFLALPAAMLQGTFQEFYAATGKPAAGLAFIVVSGVANIALDYVLMGPLGLGIQGAAIATATAEVIGGLLPLAFFASSKSGSLRLTHPCVDFKALGAAAFNGLSEMIDSISSSIVAIFYNVQLLAYLGQEGVAAYAVVEYVLMIVTALEMGYIMGVSPIISFKYGAQDKPALKSLFAYNVQIIAVMNIVFTAAILILAPHIVALFAHGDQTLAALADDCLRIYAIAFVFIGFNFFGSILFTALGNGLVSGVIAFFRTLVCESAFVLILPALIGATGIWLSAPIAEIVALVLTAACVFALGKRYGYL